MSKKISGGPGTSPAPESRSGWRSTDPNKQIGSTGIPQVGAGRSYPKEFGSMSGMKASRKSQGYRGSVEVSGMTPWPEGV